MGTEEPAEYLGNTQILLAFDSQYEYNKPPKNQDCTEVDELGSLATVLFGRIFLNKLAKYEQKSCVRCILMGRR